MTSGAWIKWPMQVMPLTSGQQHNKITT